MFRGAVLFLIVLVNFSEIYSAPAEVDSNKTEILSNEYNLNPDDSYSDKYKLSDIQYAHVEGKLNDDGNPRVKGIYYFDGSEGIPDTPRFISDGKGFKTDAETRAVIITTTTKPIPLINRGLPADLNSKTFAGFFG